MEEKKADCPCKRRSCVNHSYCDACRAHHNESKRKPACERKGAIKCKA